MIKPSLGGGGGELLLNYRAAVTLISMSPCSLVLCMDSNELLIRDWC